MVLSGVADIYDMFGILVCLYQKVCIMPHERYDSFKNIMINFQVMIDTIDHSNCIRLSREQSVAANKDSETTVKCMWPRYHKDLIELRESSSYRGVKIKNATYKQMYQTRLSTAASIPKDPLDQAKDNLFLLVKELKKGLSETVYPEEKNKLLKTVES